MKTIFVILLAGLFSLALCTGDAECAKSYKKKSNDNEVKRIGEVVVEESDPIISTKPYTLDGLYSEKQQCLDIISNRQARLAQIEILITNVTVEAEKVVLNTDP